VMGSATFVSELALASDTEAACRIELRTCAGRIEVEERKGVEEA